MPEFRPNGIRMYLATASLTDSTTRDIAIRKQDATTQSDISDAVLRSGGRLTEKNVGFPGDTLGCKVNFLKNVPFIQVESLWPEHDNTNMPKALALSVELDEKACYACSFDGKPHGIKVEVLFNGMLCASSLTHIYRDKPRGAASLELLYSGVRKYYLVERPWVILPPRKGNNKRVATRSHNSVTAEARWKQLCDALMREVKERGTNDQYERPPSAEYLISLANMDMPEDVKSMQGPASRNFGVIDVVITAGSGAKSRRYLTSPKRLSDARYKRDTRSNGLEISPTPSIREEVDVQMADAKPHPDFASDGMETRHSPPRETPLSTQNMEPATSMYGRPNGYLNYDTLQPGSRYGKGLPPLSNGGHGLGSAFGLMPNFQSYDTQDRASTTTVNPQDILLNSSSSANISTPGGPIGLPYSTPMGYPLDQSYNRPADPIGYDPTQISRPVMPPPPVNTVDTTLFRDRNPFPDKNPPRQVRFPCLGPVQYTGPLPEIGRFAVPKLTMRQPDSGNIDPNLTRPSFLLSRLVIAGLNGVHVIDHRWSTPQRIAIKNGHQPPAQSGPRKKERGEDAVAQNSLPAPRPDSATMTEANEFARPALPHAMHPVDTGVSYQAGKSSRSQSPTGGSLPPPPAPACNSTQAQDRPGAGSSLSFSNATPQTAVTASGPKPAEPPSSRRTGPAVSILGIQGPKAAPFIIDNPEELMRRQKRARRMAKQSGTNTPVIPSDPVPMDLDAKPPPETGHTNSGVETQNPAQPTALSTASSTNIPSPFPQLDGPSSPHSYASLPNDLRPSIPAFTRQTRQTARSLSPAPIPSFDSIRAKYLKRKLDRLDSTAAPAIPGPRTRSLSSLLSSLPPSPPDSSRQSTPTLQGSPSLTLSPSPSPLPIPTLDGTSEWSLRTKRDRPSPEELMVPVPNPRLNENCCLCYAEEDEDGRAVLRQVKGEKSGEFAEDMVLLGCRFFVRG